MKLIGHLASFLSYAIFGLNIVMCKDIANSDVLTPYALFFLRALGATVLFWLTSLFVRNRRQTKNNGACLDCRGAKEEGVANRRQTKNNGACSDCRGAKEEGVANEHVTHRDMLLIIVASFLGLLMPQMTFLIAIRESSSIDTSLVSTLAPIFTMFFAAYFIKEPITWKKILGVIISFVGVVFIILNSLHFHQGGTSSQTSVTGFVLLFLNCFTFALYLGAFRPLIARYSVVIFMRWMFLFTMLMSCPFCIGDTITFISSTLASAGSAQSPNLYWEISYVIVFATFVAYFLIPIGQKYIRPTLVSMYSYVQPIIAVVFSICLGLDTLTWTKCIAVVMIFLGVTIVNRSRTVIK